MKTNSLPTALHYRLRALVMDDNDNMSIKNAPTILVDLEPVYDWDDPNTPEVEHYPYGGLTFKPVGTTTAGRRGRVDPDREPDRGDP